MRTLTPLLLWHLLTACAADWIAPISTSGQACDVSDPWSCPAPLTCIEGACLRSDQARCGDGIVQPELGEACDDANGDDFDRCASCSVTFCGDGVVQRQAGEVCDDGNRQDADSCTSACVWSRCGDGIQRLDAAPGSAGYEECDDGNDADRDRCTNSCRRARCGDGWVFEGKELCDDGNTIDDDGCSNTCGIGLNSVALTKHGGCGISEGGKLLCWGVNELGAGDGSIVARAAQHAAIDFAERVGSDNLTLCGPRSAPLVYGTESWRTPTGACDDRRGSRLRFAFRCCLLLDRYPRHSDEQPNRWNFG